MIFVLSKDLILYVSHLDKPQAFEIQTVPPCYHTVQICTSSDIPLNLVCAERVILRAPLYSMVQTNHYPQHSNPAAFK